MARLLRLGILVAALGAAQGARAGDPTPEDLLQSVGIPPAGEQRGQMDVVGFVTTASQMDSVLAQCARMPEAIRQPVSGWAADEAVAAAVCPHDDHAYAARLYSLLMPHVRARTVVLIGVFHKASVFGCRDQMVFDSFRTWRGPYGPVKVSALREELLARLPGEEVRVDDDMHVVEHSIEAIVPWLQASNREVEIVPILVPHVDWDTLDRLAASLARALAAITGERGWQLGQDVALIASADAVHYGDVGWGGRDYADFGSGIEGYRRAVDRDVHLAESTLCGAVERSSLRRFLYTCVEENDVTRYRIPWCGRFSIPFAVNVASRLSEMLEGHALRGSLLGYGTSVGEASLDLHRIDGLGTTAPNNLHHWVGYPVIGYR